LVFEVFFEAFQDQSLAIAAVLLQDIGIEFLLGYWLAYGIVEILEFLVVNGIGDHGIISVIDVLKSALKNL
jgi:hypothetical protein